MFPGLGNWVPGPVINSPAVVCVWVGGEVGGEVVCFMFQCSFIPKFSIYIETCYEDNNGSAENVSIGIVALAELVMLMSSFHQCGSQVTWDSLLAVLTLTLTPN